MSQLTDKQFMMLSLFSHFDIKGAISAYKPLSLSEICLKIAKDFSTSYECVGNLTDEQFRQVMHDIANDPILGKFHIKNSLNLNTKNMSEFYTSNKNGLVVYAYENIDTGDTYFAFRGSEETISLTAIDWVDNFNLGLQNWSRQFEDVEDFVNNNFGGGDNYVTGHSKGAANAMYAYATIEGLAGGVAFDGPGIGQCLSSEQYERLKNPKFRHYVAANDVAGPLMFHPENRKFVVQNPTFIIPGGSVSEGMGLDGHYPQAICFDKNGSVIEGTRTGISTVIELATTLIWFDSNWRKNPELAFRVIKTEFQDVSDQKDLIDKINDLKNEIKKMMDDGDLSSVPSPVPTPGPTPISTSSPSTPAPSASAPKSYEPTITQATPAPNSVPTAVPGPTPNKLTYDNTWNDVVDSLGKLVNKLKISATEVEKYLSGEHYNVPDKGLV